MCCSVVQRVAVCCMFRVICYGSFFLGENGGLTSRCFVKQNHAALSLNYFCRQKHWFFFRVLCLMLNICILLCCGFLKVFPARWENKIVADYGVPFWLYFSSGYGAVFFLLTFVFFFVFPLQVFPAKQKRFWGGLWGTCCWHILLPWHLYFFSCFFTGVLRRAKKMLGGSTGDLLLAYLAPWHLYFFPSCFTGVPREAKKILGGTTGYLLLAYLASGYGAVFCEQILLLLSVYNVPLTIPTMRVCKCGCGC